ncbi:MAG: acylphosphatase [Pirellulales bacterium]|nr:acylphosphatase [Pirellulales bacterium]
MDTTATQRREIRFSGMVQGVGFRYVTRRIAGRFQVTGFVQNLTDGTVLVVAEGIDQEIDRFLDAVRADLGHYVRGERQTSGAPTGEFSRFGVRT